MNSTYLIAGISFDVNLCLLSNGSQSLKLGYKEADILKSLCEQPGEITQREPLQEKLWRNTIGSDVNLNRAIYVLRKKLAQLHPEQLDFIETIPRVGYILKCEVMQLSDGDGHDHTEPLTDNETTEENKNNAINNSQHMEHSPPLAPSKKQLTPITIIIATMFGLSLLCGLIVYLIDRSSSAPYFTLVKSSLGQQLYIDARLQLALNENKLQQIFVKANENHIRYISIGRKYVSLYREQDPQGVIYSFPATNNPVLTLIRLISDKHLSLLFKETMANLTATSKATSCQSFLLISALENPNNLVCINVATTTIPGGPNVVLQDTTITFFNNQHSLLLTTTGKGTVEKKSADEFVLHPLSLDYTTTSTFKAESHELKSIIGKYLSTWSNNKQEINKMHRIDGNIYFSDSNGGTLLKRDF